MTSASSALWYASRSTGIVALVLLTAVPVLGIMVHRKRSLPGLARFATTGLHRNLSLLALVFITIHVLTAVADPYVAIRIAAAVLPFAAAYKSFWLGLGAVSLDLVIALIVTSLLRARIGRRTWRAVHWLSYAAWPAALGHSIGSSTSLERGAMAWLGIGCAAALLGALIWRLAGAAADLPPAALPARVLAQSERGVR